MNISDFENIKKRIEESKQKRAKAEGAIEQAMIRLEKEFGCKSPDEAEKKLEVLDAEIRSDEKKLEKMMEEIESFTDWRKI